MSKKRDIDELIGHAVQQGFDFEYQPSGHWKATNQTDGRTTKISSTPRSTRGVKDARARLKRIGYKPILPPKRKVKEAKMAIKAVAVTKKPSEVEEMPKIGEMANLKMAMTTDEVRKDFTLAAYVIWQAIHTRLKADSSIKYEDRSKVLGGYKGKVWAGSRTHLVKDMWPDIERTDISRLGQYLSGSKNMATLVRGRGGLESIWWVSDEFNEVSPHEAKKTPVEWWNKPDESTNTGHPRVTEDDLEVKVTKQPEQPKGWLDVKEETKPKPKVKSGRVIDVEPSEDGLYHCPQCSFAVMRLSSLSPHMGKLSGREHPNEGEFRCKYCDEIMPTPTQLKQHHDRNHKVAKSDGVNYCDKCVDYYVGDPYKHKGDHLANRILDDMSETKLVEDTSDTDSAPPEPAISVGESKYVVAPRESVKVGKLVNAEEAIRQILNELGTLRVYNESLREHNDELVTENQNLKDELGRLKDKMAENEEFVDKLRSFMSN